MNLCIQSGGFCEISCKDISGLNEDISGLSEVLFAIRYGKNLFLGRVVEKKNKPQNT